MRPFLILSIAFVSTLPWNHGPALGYQEIELTDGGMIMGSVRFTGKVPPLPAIKVVKNTEVCGTEVQTPVLVVNPSNRGLKNTVVYLEKIEIGKPLSEKAVIDSVRCLFEPHVTGVIQNQYIAMRNSDPVLHNPHTFNEHGATVFNVAIPQQGQTVERRMRSGGVIRLQCDLHAHMNAWVISLEHPYFAVTDEEGRFEIQDIPPGRYKLVAWHEGFHMTNRAAYEDSVQTASEEIERPLYDDPYIMVKEIEIRARQTARVDFDIQGR
jgi:hypothetical protein